ncbi:MAG: DUF4097 family beta strand repeat-containing protein [Candidatus Acidiferrum sp.]
MQASAIKLRRGLASMVCVFALLAFAGCANGPGVTGKFERDYSVTGHTRLEIGTGSGDVNITGSADGKVHVHGEVRVSGGGAHDEQKRLSEIESNPPVEQTPDGVRVGRDVVRLHGASISYTIEVPRDCEVSSTAISGSQTVRGVRGPIKLQSTSGSVTAEDIDGDAQLASLSGSVTASNMGDAVRASGASGTITIAGAQGDVRVNGESGKVEVNLTNGPVNVQGAGGDVKIHGVNGSFSVQGNPSATSYWDLKNVSGGMDIAVPAGANFHLLAESTSGEIRADMPIIIEEQGKHTLRAQIGTGGGRVEAHTVSGAIHLGPSN